MLSMIADGLPLLGSVAFPPSCVEDSRRKQHISVFGRYLAELLAQHRGNLLCQATATEPTTEVDGGEAKRWGLGDNKLKMMMSQDADVGRAFSCALCRF